MPRDRSVLPRVALGVACLSLLLNGVLLAALRDPAWLARRALASLADAGGDIRYTVRIPAGTPLSLDVPVNERFRIGIDTVLPIRTTVRVPIRGPLGVAHVNVPIRADVPIRSQIPLAVRHTFRLRTHTQEPIEIPLRIPVRELLGPGADTLARDTGAGGD